MHIRTIMSLMSDDDHVDEAPVISYPKSPRARVTSSNSMITVNKEYKIILYINLVSVAPVGLTASYILEIVLGATSLSRIPRSLSSQLSCIQSHEYSYPYKAIDMRSHKWAKYSFSFSNELRPGLLSTRSPKEDVVKNDCPSL